MSPQSLGGQIRAGEQPAMLDRRYAQEEADYAKRRWNRTYWDGPQDWKRVRKLRNKHARINRLGTRWIEQHRPLGIRSVATLRAEFGSWSGPRPRP